MAPGWSSIASGWFSMAPVSSAPALHGVIPHGSKANLLCSYVSLHFFWASFPSSRVTQNASRASLHGSSLSLNSSCISLSGPFQASMAHFKPQWLLSNLYGSRLAPGWASGAVRWASLAQKWHSNAPLSDYELKYVVWDNFRRFPYFFSHRNWCC